jgi:MSHA biogenesis protein MshN
MSLINTMLQDLEKRKDADTPVQALAGDVQAVDAATSPIGHAVMWGAGVLLAIAALGATWQMLRVHPPQPVSTPIAASAPAVAPPSPAELPEPIPMAAAPAVRLPVATPSPVSPIALAKGASERKPNPPPEHSAAAQAVVKKPANANAQTAPAETEGAVAAQAAAPEKQDKSQKRITAAQQAENLYKLAMAQLLQGHGTEARRNLEQILALAPDHVKARQLLAALLVEVNALDDAAVLLRDGLQRSSGEAVFSMALARIEIETNQSKRALETLTTGLQAAGDDPQYHAFYAQLLQRAQRQDEAVQHYLVALRSDPAMPLWLVGIGISLQALGKSLEAEQAFARARDGGLLSAPMLAFVEQRLRQLH